MTSRLREATLWTGAVLGLLSVVAGTAVLFFGFSFLVFRSGSMGPEIPTGSLALARTTPAAELEQGDVVSVIASNGERITHRLVSSTLRGDEASLILRGDANGTPDQEIYQVTEVERSIVSVPFAGYVVTVLLSPAGLVAVGCLSGMLLLTGFGSRRDDTQGPAGGVGRHRGVKARNRGALVASGVAVSMTVAAIAGASVAGTSAFFTDRATLTTGTFSMAVPANNPPRNVRCLPEGLLGLGAVVAWDAPLGSAPQSYSLNYTSNAASGAVPYDAGTTQGRPPAPGIGGNRLYTVTISAVYASGSVVSLTSTTIRGQNQAGVTTWTC